MRVILIKQASDLQALTNKLLGNKPGASATLDRVKALNPHVDFNRIEAGTVLLLPDAPGLQVNDKDTHSIGSDAFNDFVQHMEEGFKAAAEHVSKAADNLTAERAAIAAVLKTDVVKRQIESDPLLKKQLEDADGELNDEQKKIQGAVKQIEVMKKAAAEELKMLNKLALVNFLV